MLNRQIVLLALIKALQNRATKTAIVKSLFLLKEEYKVNEKIKFYSFFPYMYGPFSHLCFADLRKLQKEGLIKEENNFLTKKGEILLDSHEIDFNKEITALVARFKTNKQIVNHIYSQYPQYTVKSKLIQHKKEKTEGINTIGYEGKDIDTFLNVLIQNKINMIIDVRNNPFSMNFCFIKDKLNKYLSKAEIEYKHIPELGIESSKRQNLKTSKDYKDLFKEFKKELPKKEEQLRCVGELSKNNKIALMCFEREPEFCHRHVVSDTLESMGYEKGVHL